MAIEHRINRNGTPPAPVRLLLQPEHKRLAARYLQAVDETVKALAVWFAVGSDDTIEFDDQPWSAAPRADESGGADTRVPWWTLETSMTVELAVSRTVVGQYVRGWFDVSRLPSSFVAGFVEYASRRIVANMFEGRNNPPGFAFYEGRYFGRFVPRFFRIRLLPDSDGDPIERYRTASNGAAKTALMFMALDRWLGRPTFDAVIAEFAQKFHARASTTDDFARTASEVSGQDLAWLLAPALDPAASYDYAVKSITIEPRGETYDATVLVARLGTAAFSGNSAAPIGGYASGNAVTIDIAFADDARVREQWDGRDAEKSYEYGSRSPVVSAVVDPERTVTFDLRRTNNSRTVGSAAATASRRWSVRWLVWLEQLLMTWGALA